MTEWTKKLGAKVPFLFFLGLSLTIFSHQVVICIVKFLAGETIIALENVRTSNAEFPSITICPDYGVAYKSSILSQYGVTASDMRNFRFPSVPNMTSFEFYMLVTYDLNEVLEDMFIDATNFVPGTNYSRMYFSDVENLGHPTESIDDHVMVLNFSHPTWSTEYYKTFGRCFTLDIPQWIKDTRIADITLRLHRTSVVYLHHQGQFHSQDSDTKIKVNSGEKLFMDTRHDITIDMPKELEGIEAELDASNVTCNSTLNIHHDQFYIDIIDQGMLKAYGCTSPYYTNRIDKTCDLGTYNATEKAEFMKKYYDLISEAEGTLGMPCSKMGIIFGYPVLDLTDPNETLVKLYFKSHVNVRKNVLAYSTTNLWAEVGGYIGLLLGFSLLDLTKVLKGLFGSPWLKRSGLKRKDQRKTRKTPSLTRF